MALKDERGVEYTAETQASLTGFDDVLTAYLGSKMDTMGRLDELLATERMPMAVCLRGYLMKMASDPRLKAPVQAMIAELMGLDLNEREQRHLSALQGWSGGQDADALRQLEAILDDHPRDAVALRVAHHLHFYSGDSNAMAASVNSRLSHWAAEDPFYGFVLGMASFGLEEAAEYRDAERMGKDACERNPQDIWAGHAVAHTMQMQGRWVDGVRWLTDMLPHWGDANNFVNHLHWHKALFHLGRRENDAALAIYDDQLSGAVADDFYLDACNAASLLWRLDMRGVATGDRWQTLYDQTRHRMTDDELVFCSLHYLMPAAALGEEKATNTALLHFRQWRDQDSTQGGVCAEVGEPLAQAIVSLGSGDPSGAETIEALRRRLRAIGGSWAQRDLFREMREHYRPA